MQILTLPGLSSMSMVRAPGAPQQPARINPMNMSFGEYSGTPSECCYKESKGLLQLVHNMCQHWTGQRGHIIYINFYLKKKKTLKKIMSETEKQTTYLALSIF